MVPCTNRVLLCPPLPVDRLFQAVEAVEGHVLFSAKHPLNLQPSHIFVAISHALSASQLFVGSSMHPQIDWKGEGGGWHAFGLCFISLTAGWQIFNRPTMFLSHRFPVKKFPIGTLSSQGHLVVVSSGKPNALCVTAALRICRRCTCLNPSALTAQ